MSVKDFQVTFSTLEIESDVRSELPQFLDIDTRRKSVTSSSETLNREQLYVLPLFSLYYRLSLTSRS